MPLLRRALWGLVLSAAVLWLPFAVWSKGKKWTDTECRERMEELFNYAKDPSVDISEVTDNLGPRAGTEFVMYCITKEANSLQQLEQRLGQLVAERAHTDESLWRTNRAGAFMKNFKSQASPYDPGGMPGPN